MHRATSMKTSALLSTLLLPVAAAPAAADEPAVPAFATVDRVGGDSGFSIAASYARIDDTGESVTPLRADLFGQYADPSGWGGYAALAASTVRADSDSGSAIGSVELGGFYRLRRSNVELTFRGGLTLPTADDALDGFAVNFITAWTRLTDLVDVLPESSWLRLALSPTWRTGSHFFRVDGGVDVPVWTDDGADFDPFIRLNAAGGLLAGPWALTGELVTLVHTTDDETAMHTFAVGLAGTHPRVRPSLTVILPLDDSARRLYEFILAAGLQVSL
jgi:hypothetical protein